MEITEFISNYSPEQLIQIEELLTNINELLTEITETILYIKDSFNHVNSLIYILIIGLGFVGIVYLMYRFLKIFI